GAVRNPGFLWDYVVNQHLLFFFDKKVPRDSIPDSLAFFWTMLFVRGLPWSVLIPAAVVSNYRTGRIDRTRLVALRFLAALVAVVLRLFSRAASRLEHYSLPALPALALLIGFFLTEAGAGRALVGRPWFVVPAAAAGLLSLGAAALDPAGVIASLDPMLRGF